MTVVFIGSGNLATRLSLEMYRTGMNIAQIYSRTKESACQLAGQLNCLWTTDLLEIRTDADLYIFSLKDTALSDVISQIPANKGLWVHTAGSMPMDVFEGYTERYGVLYPLQTFSKGREVSFDEIPFFLEAYRDEDLGILEKVASALTNQVMPLSSEKRKKLHLAAVFACNFTNHMYALAGKILEEEGLSSKILLPLIDETAAKVHTLHPLAAQTGPAIRYDENVINKHLSILAEPDMKEIYKLLSKSIYKQANNE